MLIYGSALLKSLYYRVKVSGDLADRIEVVRNNPTPLARTTALTTL
jgi:hypothetical protein